jgi:type IV secretory pathway component VirB8
LRNNNKNKEKLKLKKKNKDVNNWNRERPPDVKWKDSE